MSEIIQPHAAGCRDEAEAADRLRAIGDIALLMWRFDITYADIEAYCATLPAGRSPRLHRPKIKAFDPYFGG